MNQYRPKDMAVGLSESFKVTITQKMLENFLEITSDTNPLHNDASFAKERDYKDRVAYGMLTASFISTLAGVYLPGKYSLIQSVETKFVRPVYVGDELTVSGTVINTSEAAGQSEIKVLITNQNNEKVLRGVLKVGFLNE
ncbi:MAG: MaoC family dehydratase [Lachnospiraceae bacterium]|nr:MaoC family dehydratase [Lachnospiraceae bacterium]